MGSAAVLELRPLFGAPDPTTGCLVVRGEASVALPNERWAPVAEAWGIRLALLLIQRAPPGCRSVHVAGDNVAVVRFAAA